MMVKTGKIWIMYFVTIFCTRYGLQEAQGDLLRRGMLQNISFSNRGEGYLEPNSEFYGRNNDFTMGKVCARGKKGMKTE